MSSQSKLLISVLFIAVIVLCIALTRFYFDATKNTADSDADGRVDHIVRSFGDMRVFASASGFYGVLDGEDAVIIEPEWMEIPDVTSNMVIVSKRMANTVLIGGIDYEENIVLPFVFRSMEQLGETCHVGTVDKDGSCLVYDEEYQLLLPKAYDAVSYDSGLVLAESEECTFSYYTEPGAQPLLRKADMLCRFGETELGWRVANQVYLSALTEHDLLRINRCVSAYLEMLMQSDFTDLPTISGSDYIGGLTKPGSFTDMAFDSVGGFSFSGTEDESYDFAFSIDYHMTAPDAPEGARSVLLHLGFRRNADNEMILTSANLSFQSAEPPAENAADAE